MGLFDIFKKHGEANAEAMRMTSSARGSKIRTAARSSE